MIKSSNPCRYINEHAASLASDQNYYCVEHETYTIKGVCPGKEKQVTQKGKVNWRKKAQELEVLTATYKAAIDQANKQVTEATCTIRGLKGKIEFLERHYNRPPVVNISDVKDEGNAIEIVLNGRKIKVAL